MQALSAHHRGVTSGVSSKTTATPGRRAQAKKLFLSTRRSTPVQMAAEADVTTTASFPVAESEMPAGPTPNEAARQTSSSALSDETLMGLTRSFFLSENGIENPDLLASSFQFIAPVVGPLSKEQYLNAVGSFGLKNAFSDAEENIFGLTVDPVVDNCVWFMSRFKATNDGPLAGQPATGKRVELPPTQSSVTFDSTGRITKFTTGYPCDRTQGNSGGMSALFGILYAVGRPLPFREAQPYTPSLRFRIFQKIGPLLQKLSKR